MKSFFRKYKALLIVILLLLVGYDLYPVVKSAFEKIASPFDVFIMPPCGKSGNYSCPPRYICHIAESDPKADGRCVEDSLLLRPFWR